jgi:radical SAM-linked protein
MRIRVIYAKTAPLRYTGGLDMQRTWERALRRAHLPVAYSNGFHPQPRINQASALPLGFTSRSEMIDIWLSADLPSAEIHAALLGAVPPGIELIEVVEVATHGPSVQTITDTVEYRVTLHQPILAAEIQEQINRVLQAESLPRQRRDRHYDLRPLLLGLRLVEDGSTADLCLWISLAARENATGRPDEVLDELGIPLAAARIERTRLTLVP